MTLSSSQRIALNVAATYGRSLYALVVGLFAGRWLLMVLGETDYGLYGLIGGLALFVTFFNDLLATAVERFFAFAVGAAPREGLEECRRWFSVAVLLHVAASVILVAAGYPLGLWAIDRYLNIPPDRMSACLDVFRLVCLNCLVGMATVPCSAMYRAKQEIAELTGYGIFQTTANAAVLGYMVLHPGDWMVNYVAWWCAIMVLPQLVLSLRAFATFSECRFRFDYALDRVRMLKLMEFVGSRFVCAFGQVLSGQGLAVVVNKYLGVAKNAAMTVSNSVSTHVMTLSGALSGAFMPAITNTAGAGDLERMRRYAYRTCVLSSLAVAVFGVPLALEIDLALGLWLKTPPAGAAGLCLCALATATIERTADGHWMSIFALGRIRRFQLAESTAFLGAFALGWILVGGGMGVVGAGVGVLIGRSAAVLVKLHYGRTLAGLSVGIWLRRILLPVGATVAFALAVGAIPRFLLPPTPLRLFVTTGCCLAAFLALAWFVALDASDRRAVREVVSA